MAGFAEDVAGVYSPFMPEETLDCLRLDLGEVGAEETYRQLVQVEKILQGFMDGLKDVSAPLYTALGAAYSLVGEARERTEAYAGAYSNR